VNVRFCDEGEGTLGWVVNEFMERCSHALVADGGVWLIDALDGDGVEERVRALGEPAGVLQLLDRHARDCAALAGRLGVPHHRLAIGEAPFEAIPLVTRRRWREIALWWPERRVLVCADALGTARYFRAPGERLAVHPLLRLMPPRRLAGLEPERVLVGHGTGVEGSALRDALRDARLRAPLVPVGLALALKEALTRP
jgi:hypothetical protein